MDRPTLVDSVSSVWQVASLPGQTMMMMIMVKRRRRDDVVKGRRRGGLTAKGSVGG